MFKNKYIISIISFYIFWIGILPLGLTKAVDVLCKKYSNYSKYEIKIESPKIILSPLPTLFFKADNINIKAKDNSINLNLTKPKTSLRLLPLLSKKLHINSFSIDQLDSSVNMKKRFELDKEIFNKIENTPVKIDTISLREFNSKFYHQDIKEPVIYKGKNFIFEYKNRYIKFQNQSDFILSGKTSEINFNLYLPKNNDLKKTIFDIQLSNFDLAPLKIYLKNYLPNDLLNLSGYINAQANKDELFATLNNCKILMKDSAKSIELPKTVSINSKFDIKRQYINFDSINIDAKNINISMDGKISDYFGNTMPTLDFNIRINKSRIEDLIKILPPFKVEEMDVYKLKKYKFYGDILANLSIKGRTPEPEVFGNVYIDDGYLINRIPNTSKGATINLSFKGRTVDYDVEVPAGDLQKVFVNGTQDLYNTKYAKLTIKSTEAVNLKTVQIVLNPLHEILNFIIGPLPIMKIDGAGNIDISVKGNRKTPHIWGVLNILNSTASFNDISNLELKDANAKLLFNDQIVNFSNQSGLVNNKKLDINGTADLFGKFDFNITSKEQPLKELYKAILNSKLATDYKSMLPKLEKIEGDTDWDFKIYGLVKTLNDIKINENLFLRGKLLLKDNSFNFEGIKISKTNGILKLDANNADVQVSALTGESKLDLTATVKDNIADVILNIPKLNPNKIWSKQISTKYLLPFVSINLKYKGAVNEIDFENIYLNSEILENHPNSDLKVLSGKFNIEKNRVNIDNLKGYIVNNKNVFDINLKANNAFSKQSNVSGNINFNASDITILNDLFSNILIPNEIKSILAQFTFKTGAINLKSQINNNNINAFTDLSRISLNYNPMEIPINIINGNLQIKNNDLKLNKINMLADEIPVLVDGDIKNIIEKPKFNLYINSKPKQDFIDKYINKNKVYPIKIKGDIICSTKIKGDFDDFELKTNLNLSKEANIYYLGAMVGDIENALFVTADSRIQNGKNIRVKDFSYDKLIDSQSGRQTQLNMLKAWGGVEILKDDLNLKDFHIKTQNPTDARIFNIIFRKPNIKQGQFTSDLKFNGPLSNPKIIGDFHIFETDIPFFDTTMKNIELVFKDKNIDIDSKGEVMGNEVVFQGAMKNKLSQPYYLEKGLLYTKDLDLNRIFNHLKVSQMDDISTFDSFEDFKLSSISFKNLKLKADNIRLRNIQATNYEAITSLTDKGLFEVDKFMFNIAQGVLNGNYKYDLKTNNMSIDLDADKIDADDLTLALFDLKNQIHGDLTGDINLSCNGTNFEHCMETLEGKAKFNVKNGRMPKLGSLEQLLKASNLLKGGITGLSINSVIELISPLKTGEFSDIIGKININNGVANDIEITTKGEDLSLFIEGTYNFSTSIADMEVFGMLSRKMSTFFGPIGNLSINTLFNVIPGVDLSKNNNLLSKINKIPGIELSSKDFRKFIAEIRGNINGDDYVTSFKWIN